MKVRAAELHATCARPSQFPTEGLPEIAFLGRSNVGKSSLLNKLVGRKKLARTSGTPGKTRLIHFFRIELEQGPVLLADLPGYGWAKVSRTERDGWRRLAEDYLANREELRLAFVLQDLRRSWSEDESLLLGWLAERSVPGRVVLTKTDKLKLMKRKERIRKLRGEIGDDFGQPITTSAEKRDGLDVIWRTCFEYAFPERVASAAATRDEAPA